MFINVQKLQQFRLQQPNSYQVSAIRQLGQDWSFKGTLRAIFSFAPSNGPRGGFRYAYACGNRFQGPPPLEARVEERFRIPG